jgi:hypothetical protein
MRYWLLFFGLPLYAGEFGPADPDRAGVTTLPRTYILAYGKEVVGDTAFLAAIRQAPPDLLHIGHGVPLNSIFGPTADYSGWNPKLVPAQEILDRRQELKRFIQAMHEAGVKKVFCYINPSILGGDHEKRLGFFNFFDHWQDYAVPLGLGAKPERPPEQWMQIERRSFAPWEPEPDYPLWRYQPCLNEPAWENYQKTVVRLIAESGYDGIFIDDCIMECRHDLCQEGFASFLRQHYTPEALAAYFAKEARLAPAQADDHPAPRERLQRAATFQFWQNSVSRFASSMAVVGKAYSKDFFTIPNWGAISRVRGAAGRSRSGKSAIIWSRASRSMMFEEAHPSGYFTPHDVFGYLLQHLYGLAIDVQPVIISYGSSRRHVELGYAECAAGGGGAFVQPGVAYPEIRKLWRSFYEQNKELFQGFRQSAPIGLVMAYDELDYGNDDHLRQSLATGYALMARHIPMALLPKEALSTLDKLSAYEVIILPNLQFLSDAAMQGLGNYLAQGGHILSSGECGAYDVLAQPRNAIARSLFRQVGPKTDNVSSLRALRVESMAQLLPERTMDLVDALDILEPGPFNTRLDEIAKKPVEPEQEQRLQRLLEGWTGHSLSVADADHAADCRTTVYERLQGSKGDMLVHAVRYAAPIKGGEQSAIRPAPLAIRLRLPRGWTIYKAHVLNPWQAAKVIPVHENAGVMKCTLPEFEYYCLLHLQLKKQK